MNVRTRPYGRTGIYKAQKKRRFEPGFAVRLVIVAVGVLSVVGLAGAGLYGAVRWLEQSPFFTVNGVTIDGCRRVCEETVLKLSGIKPDSNLLALDLDEMAARIQQNPWIVSASISKNLPDRLRITIKEREPVAIVNMDGLYLVDSSGTLFKRLERGEKFDLPLVTGLEAMKRETGQNIEGSTVSDQRLVRALEIIARASRGARTLGVNDISEIRIEGDDLVLYTIDKGLPLRFGSAAPVKEQFKRAEKILYYLYSSGSYKKIAMVDLNYGLNNALATVKN